MFPGEGVGTIIPIRWFLLPQKASLMLNLFKQSTSFMDTQLWRSFLTRLVQMENLSGLEAFWVFSLLLLSAGGRQASRTILRAEQEGEAYVSLSFLDCGAGARFLRWNSP